LFSASIEKHIEIEELIVEVAKGKSIDHNTYEKLEHIRNCSGRPSVIPAQAGNQENGMHAARLDSGFRRNDDFLSKAKMNTL